MHAPLRSAIYRTRTRPVAGPDQTAGPDDRTVARPEPSNQTGQQTRPDMHQTQDRHSLTHTAHSQTRTRPEPGKKLNRCTGTGQSPGHSQL